MPQERRVLWLLRHAKTLTDPPAGGSDFDRLLAPRGRRDAKALAGLIGHHGKHLGLGKHIPLPQIALVSPAARTMATADLVLAGWDRPPAVTAIPGLYDGDPEEVLDHLRALDESVSSVMVVGHNPTAQALALGLMEHGDKSGHDLLVRRGFPTCALAVYTLGIERWSEVAGQTARLAGLFIPPFEAP
jgi:phosphohistidine phosphatase